jgi:predicted branched-subunit amino acid permease
VTTLHDRTTPGRDGARAMLPLLVGVAPLGLVVGVEAAVAFPVARATGSTLWTLAVGLPTLWLVTAVG